MSNEARAKATLFVGGLAQPVTGPILHEAFIPFGPIVDVTIPPPELPSSKEPHRGFGYVEFESSEDAKEAIDNMDQSELFGRTIRVNVAKEKKAEGEGLGSKTAVWEQEGYLAKYAVSEEDRMQADGEGDSAELDPMQALEQMDTAGPRQS
ncbi:RNA recognition motif-containing protein 24 [Elsinoe australis]|uniref:RNA recognition motif-containing protein 24 n=1 Tax=Elsinoe australis TaxID=40998 RepID=A0A4V6DTG4_9PEZI|nr:RNA recognition motif-containing protein 24 [Elsinoe australis]